MYHHGQGMDVNYKKAIEWYEKAAEQGNAAAQNNLGLIYTHGNGVDVNYQKAIEWYEKAAEQGNAQAEFNLGSIYQHGHGVDQSDSMAMRWYAKADSQGHEGAKAEMRAIVISRRAANEHAGLLRFEVGQRVLASVGTWKPGRILKQWYCQPGWENAVPYQIKLDDGGRIFAPADNDNCLRLLP